MVKLLLASLMDVGSYSDRSSSDNDSWDLSLNPSDGEEEVSHHLVDLEVRKKAVDLPAMEVMQNLDGIEDCVPRVGMVFDSEEQAYNFYNAYARRLGFSVRKGELKRLKSGRIYLREFLCSRQGYRAKHTRGLPKKPRPQTRTKCRACIRFKVKEDGSWVVRKFIEEHNHNFASQSEVHLLRSQRSCLTMPNDSVSFVCSSESGLSQATSDANVYLGGSKHLDFKQNYPNNCYRKRRRGIYKEGDAQVALNYFRLMQKENPGFSYAVQVDQQNQICNFFWADAKSKIDYSYFGDVVCFDTTFRTNKDGMPCAPIVGVNHHGMTLIFGCALLVDETTESFIWLFESFLNVMSGKRPKTILTDQSQAIADAIAKVIPDTQHRLCLWHIYQNAAKQLVHVYESNRQFKTNFKRCIYNAETEEEFQADWESMLDRYGLSNNEWLRGLYDIREKWALVYGREHFCAGMTTIKRIENVNASFKGYLKGTMCITDFITQYEKAVSYMRQREREEDVKSKQGEPGLTSRSSIEKQVAQIYTRNAFKTFQERFRNLPCYLEHIEDEKGSVSTYMVEMLDGVWHDRNRLVTFNSDENTIVCTCKSFEFTGILCVHALRVLLYRHIAEIPSRYFMKRWTKAAKDGVATEDTLTSLQACYQRSSNLLYSDLANRALAIVLKGVMDERSSETVQKHFAACLEELNRIQKGEHKTSHAEKVVGNVSQIDGQITIRDPAKKKKKGETGKRSNSVMERESNDNKKKIQNAKKDGANDLSFVPSCNGNFFPPNLQMQSLACQLSSGNHNEPVIMPSTEVVAHFSQAFFGHQSSSVLMHTSGIVPNFHQGQSGSRAPSVLMHPGQHIMHLNQGQSGLLDPSALIHSSHHVAQFNQQPCNANANFGIY